MRTAAGSWSGKRTEDKYWDMQEMNEGGVCSPKEDLRTLSFFVPIPEPFR